MTRTKRRNKKKNFRKKRKTKRKSDYPAISKGITLEVDSVDTADILTLALSDPYSNPAYQSYSVVARVTDAPGFAQSFLREYEWYRIAGVKMTIHNESSKKVLNIPVNTGASLVSNTGLYQTEMGTEFIVIPNRDGTNYPTGISKTQWEAAKDSSSSIWIRNIPSQKKRSFRCKPNTLTMAYEGLANTGYVQKYNQWVRNNDLGVPFYCWTVLFKVQSTIREHYHISFEYVIQYKNKNGKDIALTLEFGQRLTHPMGADYDGHTAADTNGTGIHINKQADQLVAIVPDHDDDVGPNLNGYEELDITQT